MLSLRWDSFEANTRTALLELREEAEFLDVTLVAGDGNQLKATKVILATGSTFFHKILRENPHPHPLIYLKDVAYNHLLSLVDFLYTGQTSIIKEDMNVFMDIAEDLKIKGLIPTGKQPESIPNSATPLQSQESAEERALRTCHKEKIPPTHRSHSPSKSNLYSQCQSSSEESISCSKSVIPDIYRGQVPAYKNTLSPTKALLHSSDSSNTFYDTRIVKMENEEMTIVKTEVASKNDTPLLGNIGDEQTTYSEVFSGIELKNNGLYYDTEDIDIKTEIPNTEETSGILEKNHMDTFWYEQNEELCGHQKDSDDFTSERDGINNGEDYGDHVNSPSKKSIICSVCGKSCACDSALKHHMRSHTGEKPHHCLVCHKKFSRSHELKRHTRIHTGEKPFQCLDCSQKFSRSDELKTHAHFHFGATPYQCSICHKKFPSSSKLRIHRRSHKDE